MLKVVKFGGSSLADAVQFRKAAAIVRAEEGRRYVVPSAPGKRFPADTKVTDMLLELYRLAAAGENIEGQLARIRQRFEDIVNGLEMELDLSGEFDEIRRRMLEDPQADYAASRGEYLNGRVMAAYLGFRFLDPFDVIFFNDEGALNTYKTEKVLSAALAKGDPVVIPGFYGQGKDGRVKTFSRGGSDVTGSIVASAARVDIYENWTDVSGFMVADPRIVRNPVSIHTITYRELRELSYMGAAVLHEDAIFPVRSKGIPINIRNTNKPEDEGTWIVESTAKKPKYTITGVAGKKGFCTVLVAKAMMNSEIGFGRKVLQAFEENHISFEHMPSGIDTMTVVVHESEFMDKEQQVVSAIHRMSRPDSVEIESDLALIAVVGRGMRSTRGTAARIFSALAHAHVNIRMIDQGSSELNIIIGVENRDFETAIRAIYSIFVETQL